MLKECQGCGAVKDDSIEEEHSCESLYSPGILIHDLLMECEDGVWRIATACIDCFIKIDPDMWISQKCWERINPIVPVKSLRPAEKCDCCGSIKEKYKLHFFDCIDRHDIERVANICRECFGKYFSNNYKFYANETDWESVNPHKAMSELPAYSVEHIVSYQKNPGLWRIFSNVDEISSLPEGSVDVG